MSIVMPHYLRFVRALSFVTGAGGLVACASAVAPFDSGPSDTVPPRDVASDRGSVRDEGPDTRPVDGRCIVRFGGNANVACAAGGTCSLPWSSTVGTPTCIPSGSGGNPCGTIRCAESCQCMSAAENTCECSVAVPGPLPPPDLPHPDYAMC